MSATEKTKEINVKTRLSLGLLTWLGGAVHVAHQQGNGFWDGVVWMYYVGRYVAAHFAVLS